MGDVLRALLEESELSGRMDELKAAGLWSQIAGKSIAAECRKPVVKNGVMTIGVRNASLRNELMMSRSQLITLINRQVGKEIIKEIRFIS